MLYLGDLAEQTDFGLRDILGLRSGRVTTFFSTVMLLWAGQLSLLIYWYRRKSRNDFAGRYRMWLWIGGMLQFFLAVAATEAHVPFSAYMQRIWPLDIPMYGLFCWLVPIATMALALYRLLRIELKRHRSGYVLLNLSAVAACVAALSLVVGRFLPDRWNDLFQIGSATLAHLGLATALLMHARYVVHVCNEAPRRERSAGRLMKAARVTAGYLPFPKAPRFKLPSVKLPSIALPKPKLPKLAMSKLTKRKVSSSDRKDESSDTPNSKSQQQAEPKKVAQQQANADPQSAVETRAVVTSRKKKRKGTTQAAKRRVDAAEAPRGPSKSSQRSLDDILNEYGADEEIDAETLRGLSKKQRRRLRKKQRELQRVGQ